MIWNTNGVLWKMKVQKLGLAVVLLAIAALAGYFCLGQKTQITVADVPSAIYTVDDINAAVDTAIEYFDRHFDGCTLKEIAYIGDDAAAAFAEWQQQYQVDEVIILVSSFEVDASGGDGSLEPNSTYENWQWILGRKDGGQWEHLTHGYC